MVKVCGNNQYFYLKNQSIMTVRNVAGVTENYHPSCSSLQLYRRQQQRCGCTGQITGPTSYIGASALDGPTELSNMNIIPVGTERLNGSTVYL